MAALDLNESARLARSTRASPAQNPPPPSRPLALRPMRVRLFLSIHSCFISRFAATTRFIWVSPRQQTHDGKPNSNRHRGLRAGHDTQANRPDIMERSILTLLRKTDRHQIGRRRQEPQDTRPVIVLRPIANGITYGARAAISKGYLRVFTWSRWTDQPRRSTMLRLVRHHADERTRWATSVEASPTTAIGWDDGRCTRGVCPERKGNRSRRSADAGIKHGGPCSSRTRSWAAGFFPARFLLPSSRSRMCTRICQGASPSSSEDATVAVEASQGSETIGLHC
jgi:hypothetical protein